MRRECLAVASVPAYSDRRRCLHFAITSLHPTSTPVSFSDSSVYHDQNSTSSNFSDCAISCSRIYDAIAAMHRTMPDQLELWRGCPDSA